MAVATTLPMVLVFVSGVLASPRRPHPSLPRANSPDPNCFIDVTLADTSPLIAYSDSWQGSWSSSDEATWQPGMLGGGLSLHAASSGQATFEYPGTSVAFSGQMTGSSSPSSLSFSVDGTAYTPTLVQATGGWAWSVAANSSSGMHNATISPSPASSGPGFLMGLSSITSSVGVMAETSDPTKLVCRTTDFADALQSSSTSDSLLLPSGPWRASQTYGGVNGQSPISYSSITADSTPSIKLFPPPNTTFFSLNGTVGYGYGSYSVAFDPPLPESFGRGVKTYNATQRWDKPGELLYYAPMDPQTQYVITVTGDPDGTKALGLHSWIYCDYALESNAGAEGGGSSVGAIVGGLIGGLLFLTVVGAVVFVLYRRSRAPSTPDMFAGETFDATPLVLRSSGSESWSSQASMSEADSSSLLAPSTRPTSFLHDSPTDAEVYGMRMATPTQSSASRWTSTEAEREGQSTPTPRSMGSGWRAMEWGTTVGGSTLREAQSAWSDKEGDRDGRSTPRRYSAATISEDGSTRRLIAHQDAGPVSEGEQEVEEHLPPSYNPAWLARLDQSSQPDGERPLAPLLAELKAGFSAK